MVDNEQDEGPRSLNDVEKKNLTWRILKKCLKFSVSLINDILDAFWPDEPRKVIVDKPLAVAAVKSPASTDNKDKGSHL